MADLGRSLLANSLARCNALDVVVEAVEVVRRVNLPGLQGEWSWRAAVRGRVGGSIAAAFLVANTGNPPAQVASHRSTSTWLDLGCDFILAAVFGLGFVNGIIAVVVAAAASAPRTWSSLAAPLPLALGEDAAWRGLMGVCPTEGDIGTRVGPIMDGGDRCLGTSIVLAENGRSGLVGVAAATLAKAD
ncbi:hypothetical protein AaE_005754 [Aphanomyces astaci]|uniref:Uncharacterized protein n=1 Tax=Aphanomyces astaci TaxID=112090 RepID=A0A6A5ALM0_APHAT|nr:hypothetical protein AaE_005754 [Aphanomyces astaci]